MLYQFTIGNSLLNKVKESKYKDPDQIYKVPVQSNFLNHFVMATPVIYSGHSIIVYEKVKTNTAEYVKAMETRNKEKESCKIGRSILIVCQVSSKKCSAFCHRSAIMCAMYKVSPFPCLAT